MPYLGSLDKLQEKSHGFVDLFHRFLDDADHDESWDSSKNGPTSYFWSEISEISGQSPAPFGRRLS